MPEREGILRAIDGQHRLLALHADIDRFQGEDFAVPAIIFDRLPEDHVVQMFVTINAKHTRLNASHLVSLSGRQLYRDEALADRPRRRPRAERSRRLAALRRDQAARRRPRPRRAGAAGAGAQEAVRRPTASSAADAATSHEEAKKFFVNYFKQIALVFGGAWNGRKYSIRIGVGAARLHPRRAGRDQAASTRSTPTARTSARSAA